jgi:hypothetical protein
MEETILSLEKGAMERWRQGDPWGWTDISAEEVTYLDPGLTQPIVGLEAYKAYLKPIEGTVHYQGSEFIDPQVVMVGGPPAAISAREKMDSKIMERYAVRETLGLVGMSAALF